MYMQESISLLDLRRYLRNVMLRALDNLHGLVTARRPPFLSPSLPFSLPLSSLDLLDLT
jgi:hypothetical protein